MVHLIKFIASLLLASSTNGLTARTKFGSRATPYRTQVAYEPKYYVDYRSHRQSNSRLTSTHVEARPVSSPSLSVVSRKVSRSLQSLSKTFKRRKPQRILIGTILAVIMLFGPAFSPAANAASTLAVPTPLAAAPAALSTPSRALGTFNFLPTKAELELCFRLIYAACSGAFIGLERSSQDRPAGVRTMALVGLGACIFTVCSTHGFLPPSALGYAPGSPMLATVKYDPSRMAASVASGVGFIGAGAIHKSKMHGDGTEAQNVVAGLTTAAAIWVSAAVGVASATGLYFVSAVSALSTVSILRFAKVTKEDEPGFSWGARPLEVEDELYQAKSGAHLNASDQESYAVTSYPEKKPAASKIEIRGSNISIKRSNNKDASDKEHHTKRQGLFGYESNDQSFSDEVFGKPAMDPRLEQYLRRRDKEEAYACLEQDVRVLESRVHQQNTSAFKP